MQWPSGSTTLLISSEGQSCVAPKALRAGMLRATGVGSIKNYGTWAWANRGALGGPICDSRVRCPERGSCCLRLEAFLGVVFGRSTGQRRAPQPWLCRSRQKHCRACGTFPLVQGLQENTVGERGNRVRSQD